VTGGLRSGLLAALAFAVTATAPVHADEYPSRQIELDSAPVGGFD